MKEKEFKLPQENLAELCVSGDVLVDFKGHFTYDNALPDERYFSYLFAYSIGLIREMKDLKGDDSDKDIILNLKNEIIVGSQTCTHCGKGVMMFYKDRTLTVETECPNAGGLKPWDLEIDVPSGKLVFQNDMRNIFDPNDEAEDFDVNTVFGTKQTEEAFAKMGMIHVFVGNSCPRVYQFEDGKIVVGSYYISDQESKDYDTDPKEKFSEGSVCTDLWWFSACDYDKFKELGGNPDDRWTFVVDLKNGPGKYKCKSLYSSSGKYHADLEELAIIEKVK